LHIIKENIAQQIIAYGFNAKPTVLTVGFALSIQESF